MSTTAYDQSFRRATERTDSIHHRPGGVDALSRLAEDNERLVKENEKLRRELAKASSAATRKSSRIKSLQSQISDFEKLVDRDPSPVGELHVMGDIEVSEPDGPYLYGSALLITFDTHEDIRKAISMGRCEFSFGEKS